jgi:hypothetical protein
MLTLMYARPEAPSFLEAVLRERRTALILVVAGAMLLAVAYACPNASAAIDGLFLAP